MKAAKRIGETVATMSFFEPDAARIIAAEHDKAGPVHKSELAQAELCVLGSMILDPTTIEAVLPILKAEDFFYPANRIIFEHLLLMRGDGWEIGLATLNQHLAREGRIGEVGGANYLISLAEGVPSTAHAEYYARVVRKHARLRCPAEHDKAEEKDNGMPQGDGK